MKLKERDGFKHFSIYCHKCESLVGYELFIESRRAKYTKITIKCDKCGFTEMLLLDSLNPKVAK